MKTHLLTIAALLCAMFVNAQSQIEDVEIMQAELGKDKKEIVAEFVKVSDSQKEAFWGLYDAYEIERKTLGKQRIALYNQYVEQYKTMTSEQADAWTKSTIELQKKTDELIVAYYTKVREITDGIVAIQFYQIEYFILTDIRIKVLDEIPFVNEKK